MYVPYFLGYKMKLSYFQNNPKTRDPSNKMDLDLFEIVLEG